MRRCHPFLGDTLVSKSLKVSGNNRSFDQGPLRYSPKLLYKKIWPFHQRHQCVPRMIASPIRFRLFVQPTFRRTWASVNSPSCVSHANSRRNAQADQGMRGEFRESSTWDVLMCHARTARCLAHLDTV